MVLRLIALLFGAAALLIGMVSGWSLPLGEMLGRLDGGALNALQDFVRRVFWSGAWDSVFLPLFAMPAWSALAGVALVLFTIAALQPTRGRRFGRRDRALCDLPEAAPARISIRPTNNSVLDG